MRGFVGLVVAVIARALPLVGADPPLGTLIHDLQGKDAAARVVARQLLPRQGVEAAPALMALLTSDDAQVRHAAFDVLMDLGNLASSPGFEADRARIAAYYLDLLDPQREDAEKVLGLRLLERIAPEGTDLSPIGALLLSKAPLCEHARSALVRMGTPSAAALLRESLADADPDWQCALLNGLADMRSAASLSSIEKFTKSEHPAVRAAAMRALAWTGDPAYLKRAKAVVAGADDATRAEAVDALLRLLNEVAAKGGNAQIVQTAFLEVLERGEGVEKDAALSALSRMGDGRCVGPILAAMKDADVRTRYNAVSALALMPGAEVTIALMEAWPTLDPRMQENVLPALGQRHDARVWPALEQAANASAAGGTMRLAALETMGDSELPQAVEFLAKVLWQPAKQPDELDLCQKGLKNLAVSLRAQKQVGDAGFAYAALLLSGNDEDKPWAIEGILACPTSAGFAPLMEVVKIPEHRSTALRALLAVGDVLAAAGQKQKAITAYQTVIQGGVRAEDGPRLVKALANLGVEVNLSSLMGVVHTWWLLGPFELGDADQGWKDALIGEPNVDLKAGVKVAGKDLAWKKVRTQDPLGKVDLRAELADRDRCIGYAYAEITVEKDTPAVLLIGADDSERVWVNGKQVFDLFQARGFEPDKDRVEVKLTAGVNRILVKIWQNGMGWEFAMRITDLQGAGLRFQEMQEN